MNHFVFWLSNFIDLAFLALAIRDRLWVLAAACCVGPFVSYWVCFGADEDEEE